MVLRPSYSLALLGPSNSSYFLKYASNVSLTTPGGIGNYSSSSSPLASTLGDSLNSSSGHGLICKEVKSQNWASNRISESAKSSFAANETGLVSNGTALTASGTHHLDWKPINFKMYFKMLNDQSLFEDDEDIPDEDYFELTPENVRDSLMEQWYTSWTVVAQGRPAWKKYGEWGAFWREFLHEPNFKCPSGFTSCNYHPPSVQDIRRMFPNNRVLGRRVLFTSLIYEIMHALTNELDVSVLSPTD